METILTSLQQYINIYYTATVTLIVFGILKYIFKSPTAFEKRLISIIIGLIFGFVWIYFVKTSLEIIILSFTVSVVLYDWIIKPVMKIKGVKYNNGKGIV